MAQQWYSGCFVTIVVNHVADLEYLQQLQKICCIYIIFIFNQRIFDFIRFEDQESLIICIYNYITLEIGESD